MGEKLDRFARGQLSAAESRELAQQALDDHDLFDELTFTALARRARAPRARKQITWPRMALLATAAAVVAGVALFAPQRKAGPVTSAPAVFSPPVLLARNGDSNLESFRGVDAGSRESRATGSIRSVAAGTATINLGSLDGLAKGAEVDVTRGNEVVGHLKLTTIFRDHSRGEIAHGGSIRVNDQIHVPPAARLRAVLDQIAATLARGEAEKAMGIAQQTPLERFEAELSDPDDLNNAGVIAELHGDRSKAEDFYRRALQTNPSGQDRQAIESNVARLKGGQ